MSGKKEDSEWTKANLRTLVVSMRRSLPEKAKRRTYAKGLDPVDWKKVAFPPFSPEACRKKWEEILRKTCKMRSLTEVIIDAEEAIKVKPHKPPREPKQPVITGYQVFAKEHLPRLWKKFPRPDERWAEVSKMWKELSSEERERYKEKVDENRIIKYSMELWKWFKTLTPAEQEDYMTRNPSKRKSLEIKRNTFYEKEEPDSHSPSDSEDDDIKYSSSDEQAIDWDCEKDEVEEEEGEDVFEMYW